ncbi:HvfC family RiPP maturation protein [Methylobacter sp. YRD-M1]|uniref:HvfC family RiPP maturation protein n=1 Tax=Methylobacter sp. YRD-M1 TaxID=2911520 RepID=UPI00227AD28F|nr:putative DNA-binding domain-containing protein [Methylobacter sp. YRD-M1]WAK02649.1 putative DNA-binding domain-containing protein [Methylobacter sp. YRD-M1]
MKNSQPDTAKRVDFKAKQLEFAAYIRDPENNPAPADVKAQRMAMYRELFFNNVESFLSSSFPVLRSILDDPQWFKLAQDFFASHRCQSPYFSEIPEEFLDYLQNERDNPEDLPFLLELAHYEWVETALAIAKVNVIANSRNDIDTLPHKRIALSPLAWPLAYQYPVHQISPDFVPTVAPEQPTFLIVYRNIDDEVHFSQITGITYRLLQLIQENEGLMAEDYLKQVAQEANHPDPAQIMEGGLAILKEWAEKTIITVNA